MRANRVRVRWGQRPIRDQQGQQSQSQMGTASHMGQQGQQSQSQTGTASQHGPHRANRAHWEWYPRRGQRPEPASWQGRIADKRLIRAHRANRSRVRRGQRRHTGPQSQKGQSHMGTLSHTGKQEAVRVRRGQHPIRANRVRVRWGQCPIRAHSTNRVRVR